VKGEIFVTGQSDSTVSVISDSSGKSVSPSSTVLEFNNSALVAVVVAMVVITLCAATLKVKKSRKQV